MCTVGISVTKTTSVSIDAIWEDVGERVVNNLKISMLKNHVSDILLHFTKKIDFVVAKYARYLPKHVVDSEIDDLKTLAKLEFLETLKVWNPYQNSSIWPLAQRRIIGAMKDHIRYVTKSDPSRFYEWMTDAAHIFTAMNDRADVSSSIETGVQLDQAMSVLTYRERKIVIAHTKQDKTFREISEKVGVSESQVSRIYKRALAKLKKALSKD